MYYTNYTRQHRPIPYNNRFISGGFAVPFILGGITGSLLTPGGGPRPIYRPPYPPYPYPPYPIYY